LLSAERIRGDRRQWNIAHDSRNVSVRAFGDIDAQRYSVYQDVAS